NYDITVTNSAGAITSAVATLMVNLPPTVNLLPTNGSRFIEKDVIGVDVLSADTDGTVTNVALLGDGSLLTQWNGGSSNHFAWSNVVIGSHTIKAVVTDNDGATNTATA